MMITHIKYDSSKNLLSVLDQRKLPEKEEYLELKNLEDVAFAIKELVVRGAPLIGITAAYGIVIYLKNYWQKKTDIKINDAFEILASTRPTAVNLFWALNEMEKEIKEHQNKIDEELILKLEKKAFLIHQKDFENNKKMGEWGASLLEDTQNILTHCNAGWLATGGWGTAIGVIFSVWEKNHNLHVWIDETRPILQGSRLTAYEMLKMGVKHTVICDNMAGFLMSQGEVDAVIVGADRITKFGDVANKIGSYSLAVLCHFHNIPFYVAAPFTTIDLKLEYGKEIPIEERKEEEIKRGFGKLTAPLASPVYNPAFDVIPSQLIKGIITEKGVFQYPYDFSKINEKERVEEREQ